MLSCGHERPPHDTPTCAHVAEAREALSLVRWHVGVRLDAELICKACADARERGESVEVTHLCEACHRRAVEDHGGVVATGGQPEVLTRPEGFELELREIAIPRTLGKVVDFASVRAQPSEWLLLGEDGAISRLDVTTGEACRLAESALPDEDEHRPWNGNELRARLHASRDGRFAAVSHDFGRYARILDLTSGAPTGTIDGGDYRHETVRSSMAFAELGGRTVAIHRSDWNRLEMTEAATGRLLTSRGPTSHGASEERPEHHLDFFHGALHVSPSDRRVAVDGWVWHPVGVVASWSLAAWEENEWESEDGPSKRDVCFREYYWNTAMTWLDDDTLVVGGIGDDDAWMIDGARVFDLTRTSPAGWPWCGETAVEVAAFAGPRGTFFTDGSALYAADEAGLSRWDLREGTLTGLSKGFHPTRRHDGSGVFAELVDGRLLRCGTWRSLERAGGGLRSE